MRNDGCSKSLEKFPACASVVFTVTESSKQAISPYPCASALAFAVSLVFAFAFALCLCLCLSLFPIRCLLQVECLGNRMLPYLASALEVLMHVSADCQDMCDVVALLNQLMLRYKTSLQSLLQEVQRVCMCLPCHLPVPLLLIPAYSS